ncbi:MAG: hypothetical protein WA755_01760 [Candidatus Acidiferrales bacterium]
MNSTSASALRFPAWVRWAAVIWLMTWAPIYAYVWGPSSFVYLCDIAVILTCVGLWSGSALLISSQAVSSLVVDSAWIVDIVWKLLTGWHLIGGTDYFFDVHYPLWVRMLSLYHVALPIVLVMSLRRTGYDARGLKLQAIIAALAITAAHFVEPWRNINFSQADPFLHKSWGPAPVHIACMTIGLIVVVYVPTHLVLSRLFPAAKTG